jgi:hypothetical protein
MSLITAGVDTLETRLPKVSHPHDGGFSKRIHLEDCSNGVTEISVHAPAISALPPQRSALQGNFRKDRVEAN